MDNPKCPVCGSKKISLCLESEDCRNIPTNSQKYNYLKCFNCNSLFLDRNRFDKDYYDKAYGSKYYRVLKGPKSYFEDVYSAIINNQKWNIIKTLRRNSNNINILDIGAGNLKFLSANKDIRIEKYAIDIYKHPKNEKDIKIISDDFLKHQFKNVRFDFLTAWHVIEHIPDTRLFLQKIGSILKKGGYLVFSTPNTNSMGFKLFKPRWYHFDAPRHTVLFNDKYLRKLGLKQGFKFVKEVNMFYEFPLDIYHSASKWEKVFILPLYPFLKLLSRETVTLVFQKK